MPTLRRILTVCVLASLLGACGVSWKTATFPDEHLVTAETTPDRSDDGAGDDPGETGSTTDETTDETRGDGGEGDLDPDDESAAADEAGVGAGVEIVGDPLPPFDYEDDDEAIGRTFPEITGTGIDGRPLAIGDTGAGKVVVVTAHWCPTCQSEIPELVEHLRKNPPPDGVEVYGLTTAIDESRGNFPPSRWLDDAGWTAPTLLDDGEDTGSMALGVTAFPTFIVVDADNRVVSRTAGALEAGEFGRLVEAASGAEPQE